MKPMETNAVSIDTTVVQGNEVILCRGTHVYQPGQEGAGQGDTLDPGLVMTGTKCGEGKVTHPETHIYSGYRLAYIYRHTLTHLYICI
jgi:hypothetical protein